MSEYKNEPKTTVMEYVYLALVAVVLLYMDAIANWLV